MKNLLEPIFFETPSDFRKWLMKNHEKAKELIVGYYKSSSGKKGITWSQSVDEAICFGWIDGVRKSIDDERYCIRFTPRKPGSIWSAVNIKKVEELSRRNKMQEAGILAFSKRKENKSAIYSYEKEATSLPNEYLEKFKSNPKAFEFFKSMPPSYQKTAIHCVMDAKREATREKRLLELIKDSEAGRKIKRLSY